MIYSKWLIVQEERVTQEKRKFWLHTLGPAGTNCEAAAHYWLEKRGYQSDGVVLYETLEKAVAGLMRSPDDGAMLGCIVYPRLHEVVFQNMTTMSLRDCFVMPTHPMVLAAKPALARKSVRAIRTVASHPAPVNLLDDLDVQIKVANSNSDAALACARGEIQACITTIVAAESNGLAVIKDFGPVPMGFSIHAAKGVEV
jgi:hypothetical protein